MLTRISTIQSTSTPLPFGTLFPIGDDNFGVVPLNFNFNYFSNIFSQLTINTNGYVYFGTCTGCNIQFGFGNAIPALNSDLDTRTNGGIYYQNLNSQSNDFNLTKSYISKLNSSYEPTNMFRITYDNVRAYGSSSSIATFQIILSSDAVKSYVVLKYTSCLSNSSLLTTPGLYFLSNGQQVSSLISNPCYSSNVNLVGTWVFDASVLTSNLLIKISIKLVFLS